MNSLFIDTTQKFCNIVLLNEKKEITNVSFENTSNNVVEIVTENIKKISKGKKVDSIYLINGPGSFTGTRVGCLIAKTYKEIFNKDTYVMNSLLFQLPNGTGVSVIDAKGKKNYVAVYKKYRTIVSPRLLTVEQTNELTNKYNKLDVFTDYRNLDVKKNLINSLKHFKKTNKLRVLYIKDPVNVNN